MIFLFGNAVEICLIQSTLQIIPLTQQQQQQQHWLYLHDIEKAFVPRS